MSMRRRINRLEARTAPALGPVEVTHLIVAPSPEEPTPCGVLRQSDGLRLDRAEGEAEAAFRARAEAVMGKA